jgi:hypothetical protein
VEDRAVKLEDHELAAEPYFRERDPELAVKNEEGQEAK